MLELRSYSLPLPLTFALAFAAGPCGGGGAPHDPCASSGDPIVHEGASIDTHEAWPVGTHVVRGTLHVRDGGALLIPACATVRLGPDATIDVERGGSLSTLGTATEPVSFEREDASQPWGRLLARAGAELSLSHTSLTGGGGPPSAPIDAEYAGATLVALGEAGDDGSVPESVLANHVRVLDSTGLGVMMRRARFRVGSTALQVTGAGTYPLYTGVASAGSLPPESVFTGNGADAILLQSIDVGVYELGDPLLGAVTLEDHGVPYRVGHTSASILVGDEREGSPNASLTIAAGVTMEFPRQTTRTHGVVVNGAYRGGGYQAQGALIVEGTASHPVVFTSAEASPAAGDWMGIYFSHAFDPRTRIDHAEIRFAGGDSLSTGFCPARPDTTQGDADCSIIFFLDEGQTPSACVTNTRIADGLGCGIYRGWRDDDVDMRGTNTFERLEGCDQSGVRQEGSCTSCE